MDFNGKHVWIIGASSGIGRELSHELARRGARLTLSARNEAALADLKASLGAGHATRALDVTDIGALLVAANDAGPLDSVILLAGTYTPMPLAALNGAQAKAIIDTNLGGALNCILAVLPVLRRQGRGQFVFCGSVAGYRGLPNAQPYAATKAAIISLAETMRAEEGKNGIDVRIINPGFVKTPMTDKNPFAMPMMISAEDAAHAIADGLSGGAFEIHFPRTFTLAMKILRFMPDAIYFALMRLL